MKLARLIALLAISTGLLSWPMIVSADTVTIGLSTGGPITTEATGPGVAQIIGLPFGTFTSVTVSAQGVTTLVPPDLLFSNTINSTTASGGTLDVWVTDQGIPSPNGVVPFGSSFTVNKLPAGWSVTESTFMDVANGLFGGTPLSSFNFSSIGTNMQNNAMGVGPGVYSVTEKFEIRATSAGDSNDTADLEATPVVGAAEPSMLVMLGLGLVGVGLIRRCTVRVF